MVNEGNDEQRLQRADAVAGGQEASDEGQRGGTRHPNASDPADACCQKPPRKDVAGVIDDDGKHRSQEHPNE